MKRISSPIESRIKNHPAGYIILEVDYLIVGSGYGGAVAAMRLASDGKDGRPVRSVAVLERGREYGLGDFPYDVEDIPSHIRIVRNGIDVEENGYADALFNIHVGSATPVSEPAHEEGNGSVSATDVLVGSGLGGTSLINANVAEEPKKHVFEKDAWPEFFRDTPNPLADEFEEVRKHLGVTTHISTNDQVFHKYAALQRLGQAEQAEVRPACIAVTTQRGTNSAGVNQNPCTDCGNCVTGCNVGAKNTLDRNLLPLAKSRGADFYTGATVHTIEPISDNAPPPEAGFRWRVIVHTTVQPAALKTPDTYKILAHNVILAAGTLGSTEILLRSQSQDTLMFSSKLGERFSTNGDGIAMSYGQQQSVGSIAGAEQKKPHKKVGPTITGILQTDRLSIEEASIPASLARVFSEIVTSGAMLRRLSDRSLPDLFAGTSQDPLAASMQVADHCQALLVMGDDDSKGKLELDGSGNRIRVSFPSSKGNGALLAADNLLKKHDRAAGLDGGQYVPNPLWQMMPPQASAVLGDLPDGRVLTVHPLGGCAMGDDICSGVVNEAGQVFNPADDDVHKGLYVFDGSIIPTALEVNPFLTIAALAWRNASQILEKVDQPSPKESSVKRVISGYGDVGEVPDRQRHRPGPTDFAIREQLTGAMDSVPDGFNKLPNLTAEQRRRLKEVAGLVVEVRASSADALTWLDNPGSAPLHATMDLYVNPLSALEVEKFRPVGVTAEHLQRYAPDPFLSLSGSFTVFEEDGYNFFSDHWGGAKSLLTYVKRRGLKDTFALAKKGVAQRKSQSLCEQFKVFFNIGVLQNRRRRLRYDFRNGDKEISISGEKVLGYSCDLPRLWDGLFNLQLQIKAGGSSPVLARLKVNADALLDPGLVAVRKSPNLPQSLLFAGGLAAFVARSVVMTNFWEFGGMEYPKAKELAHKDNDLPHLETNEGHIAPRSQSLAVPTRAGGEQEGSINLLLTNYQRTDAQPVLLLHGLAQGSEIFRTRGITNMARYFYEHNFDVWLLDYRLSNLVLTHLEDRKWGMDEIALFDIPMAIEKVYEETGGKKVAIFGHCVGACTLAMAVLAKHSLSDKIQAAVTNAIHPWVTASPGNRFRAKLGNFSRDWIPGGLLDPIPKSTDSAAHRVIDRLAFSLARMREVQDDHAEFCGSALSNNICDRMTFLYGRMWNHENLHRKTHETFEQMLGPAPLGVYQHLYYFSQLRRITNAEGENTYLNRRNIESNWNIDILFVHGGDSLVFNPHSAVRSAKHMSRFQKKRPASRQKRIGYEIYPGYGHMDVIFGKNAHQECFQDYVDFLRQPTDVNAPTQALDWPEPHQAKPRTGPILRAAWIENGDLRLRFWAELKTDSHDPGVRLRVSGNQLRVVYESEIVVPYPHINRQPQFRFTDVEIKRIHGKIALQIFGDNPHLEVKKGVPVEYHNDAWLRRLQEYSVGPAPRQLRMCFVVGSCRYPGAIVDQAMSDRVYEAIKERVTRAGGPELLFLVGDQIYADATDQLFGVGSLSSRYTDRYRRAFSAMDSPHFATLVQQIPTHFALDDHEFDDNWSDLPQAATVREKQHVQFARETAARFMSSARNQLPLLRRGDPHEWRSPSPFYYPLAHPQECDFPVFVADTRSKREFRCANDPARHKLFDDVQLGKLTAWLKDAAENYPEAPKFIVSGSIIAPLPMSYCREGFTWRQQDGWAGYPLTLETVLAFIAKNKIKNVVFIGGDAHLSAISNLQIRLCNGAPVEVWQIVSSGLYAPMPFANAHVEDYEWDVVHCVPVYVNADLSIHCSNTLLSDTYSQYVEVDATQEAVSVICRDNENNTLAEELIRF